MASLRAARQDYALGCAVLVFGPLKPGEREARQGDDQRGDTVLVAALVAAEA